MGKNFTDGFGGMGGTIIGDGIGHGDDGDGGGDDGGGSAGSGAVGMGYKDIEKSSKALSDTPALLFSAVDIAQSGWRLHNSLSVSIYLSVLPVGTTPTFAQMVTDGDRDATLQAGETAEDGASNSGMQIWACLPAGQTGTVYPRRLKS